MIAVPLIPMLLEVAGDVGLDFGYELCCSDKELKFLPIIMKICEAVYIY